MPILQSDWQHRLNETSLVLLRCTCGIINFFFTFFTSQSSNNAEKDEHSYEFLKMYHLPEVNAAVKEQNRATRVAVEAIKSQRIIDITNSKAGIKTKSAYAKTPMDCSLPSWSVNPSPTIPTTKSSSPTRMAKNRNLTRKLRYR